MPLGVNYVRCYVHMSQSHQPGNCPARRDLAVLVRAGGSWATAAMRPTCLTFLQPEECPITQSQALFTSRHHPHPNITHTQASSTPRHHPFLPSTRHSTPRPPVRPSTSSSYRIIHPSPSNNHKWPSPGSHVSVVREP